MLPLPWLSLILALASSPPVERSTRVMFQNLVRRADITVDVASAERTVKELEDLARTVGGQLTAVETMMVGGRREVKATLVMPADMMDTALARLREIALTVVGEKVDNQNVSSEVSALYARLHQLRIRRSRLRVITSRAENASERREVEAVLSDTEDAIATSEAELSELLQQVDWGLIRILAREILPTPTSTLTPTPSPTTTPTSTPTATPVPIEPSPTPWKPNEAVARATDTLVSIVQDLTDAFIVAAIVGGPFLVTAAGARWLLRRFRS